MSAAGRRVETVRLRAKSDSLIRRGAILLEDALHTASLPDGDGSRLYVVRSLSVGAIRTRQSSASLALVIESRFAQMRDIAVYALTPSANAADVVWFRDPIEPYILLAIHLAQGESPGEWFWPLVVSEWQPETPRETALRSLLIGLAQRDSGPLAVVNLVTVLHRQSALVPLLDVLTPQDGARLLQVFGWPLPSALTPPSPLPISPRSSPSLQQTSPTSSSVSGTELEISAENPETANLLRDGLLASRVASWGVSDSRSLWLVGVLLLAARPARWLDPGLPLQMQQLVRQAEAFPSLSSAGKPSSAANTESSFLPAAFIASRPAPVSNPDVVETKSDPLLARPDTSKAPAPHNKQETEPAQNPEPYTQLSISSDWAGFYFFIPALTRLGMADFLESNPEWIARNFPIRLLHHLGHRLNIAPDDPVLSVLPPIEEFQDNPEALHSPLSAKTLSLPGEERAGREGTRTDGFRTVEESNGGDKRSMAIGRGRGVMFIAPEFWRRELCDAHPLRLQRMINSESDEKDEDADPFQILCDSSGRLILAVWCGVPPEAISEWISGPLTVGPETMPPQSVETLLVNSWRTALRRWCRRRAGIGLATIAHRPGGLLATRTHLDIFFDLQQADVRIRKSGLDIDPGWVVWLGRILLFHYIRGGMPDA